ncbi:Nucleic acid-binding, OB-fold-like protein [Cordyceps fumosorosea ARSEF 2679]|uniref:Nucleic acid-binding, OB-fold-like protein n=1 Tax=Cordyceps fumosorosea (strain ARSEF 2679) TaxID=1081104 RepID=A0A162MTU8_CORFA|nr:Nucleic acid-binding, OB-fold-like protein [Cordyceps fumosorosea ARSEF 2679]OAA70249.1 Nucleic acid-binding, OB-fold-like protein [Cordyceps fumosorosea ARSEF 2679]
MPPRIILLAGAPSPSVLDEDKCTVNSFQEPFHAFIDAAETRGDSHSSSSASIAPWRSISLHPKPLHTGFSQAHDSLGRLLHGGHQHDDFFCPPSLASSCDGGETASRVDEDDVLTEFCEQSLAIHNSLPSSPLAEEEEDDTDTFLEGETSFLSASPPPASGQQRPPAPAAVPPGHLSDLEDVPPARQVASLHPQTVTVNLIAGVLSVAPPRAVTTRWGAALSLVEVLLGDDTRSGFAVTFWLPSDAAGTAGGLLLSLRRQDVVLLQNVALHVFRGKVYGQSLRRGRTKVHLLWSRRREARACYSSRALAAADARENPQLVKTRLVRDWILQFVGADPAVKGPSHQNVWDRPPRDTQ